MPELPEVERSRRMIERIAAGRRVDRVVCANDDIVYTKGSSPAAVRRALKGREIYAVHRRGKYVWLETDRLPQPIFHLGMTGIWRTPGEEPLRMQSSGKNENTAEWPPRWTKIRLVLDDGGELAMTNKRRLGRIHLREHPATEPPISKLGFDPMLDLPSPQRFTELLARRSGVVKAVLLDQSFAAGVGNWIADEILYQAKIDPRRRADSLSDPEAKRVRTKMRSIIRKAVEVDADKSRFPRTWLFHYRWGKQQSAITSRGESIQHLTVGGRTTAWAPSVQK